MNEKPVKVDIDFNEALRRIARTPKGAVVKSEDDLVNTKKKVYNVRKAKIKSSPRSDKS